MAWIDLLRVDPLAPLLASGHPAVRYWVASELVPGSAAQPKEALWDPAIPRRILRHQAANGSWAYPGQESPGPDRL